MMPDRDLRPSCELREATLDEMLADRVMRTLMARDGVKAETLRALVTDLGRRRAAAGLLPADALASRVTAIAA
jgi:hypothetical protein